MPSPALRVRDGDLVRFRLAAAKRPLTKALAMLWGPLVCLTVVATGNHYVFDIAAGLVVAAAGYGAGQLFRRYAEGLRPVLALRPVLGAGPA